MKLTKAFFAIYVTSFTCLSYSQGLQPQLQVQNNWYDGTNITGAGIMLPYVNGAKDVSFFDLRYYRNNKHGSNVSVGLGYRHVFGDDFFIGANSYFDSIHTNNRKYRQFSLGLEYIGKSWKSRANAYIPFSDKEHILETSDLAVLHDDVLGLETLTSTEYLGKGFDIELGYNLWDKDSSIFDMYAGGYWQDTPEKNINGIKLRGEWRLNRSHWLPKNTSIVVSPFVAYDNNEDLRFGLQLQLGLGSNSSHSNLAEVQRRLVAVSYQYRQQSFEKADNIGNVGVFDLNNTTSNELNQNINVLGENGVALVSGTATFADTVVLPNTQQLIGGGGSVDITTKSGKHAQYIHDAPAAIITNSTTSNGVVAIGSRARLGTLSLKGGAVGVITLASNQKDIVLSDLDISETAGDGIKLDSVSGIQASNIKIHNLTLCENNTECEYAVMQDPNRAPNAAFRAVGSENISINDLSVDTSTYGVFIATAFDTSDPWNLGYKQQTNNVTLNNINIENVRREGMLLVGVDGVTVNNLTIDNSKRTQNGEQDMDLLVLQASKNITLDQVVLDGGINGLMVVNAMNLPAIDDSNINTSNMTIKNTKKAGIFLNPVSQLTFNNIKINNAAENGIILFGNEWMGGPVKDIKFDNFTITAPQDAVGISFMGITENIRGNITTNKNAKSCMNMWGMGSITQNDGSVFSVNNSTIDSMADCK